MERPDIAYVMDTFRLTEREAVRRIALCDLAPIVSNEARLQLQERYAGSWCDLAADLIFVGFVGDAMDTSLLEQDARLVGHLNQVQMSYSLEELGTVATHLAELIEGSQNYSLVGVEIPLNRVTLFRASQPIAEDITTLGVDRFIESKSGLIVTHEVANLPTAKKLPRYRGL